MTDHNASETEITPEQLARLKARLPEHLKLLENRDPNPVGGNPGVNHAIESFYMRPRPRLDD